MACALLLGGASVGACAATSATKGQLLNRAAFDFNCAQQELEVVELDARSRGVRGCGQQATYIEVCEQHAGGYVGPGTGGSYRTNCTWALNTDAKNEVGKAEDPSPAP